MNFNSIGSSGNFARGSRETSNQLAGFHGATLRNMSDMGKLVTNAATRRTKERIAAIKAETGVAKAGIDAKGFVTADKIVKTADRARDKSKRKAGALAAGGKMIAGAGALFDEPRKKREVGESDAWYDKMITSQTERTKKMTEILNSFRTEGETSTPEAGTTQSSDTSTGTQPSPSPTPSPSPSPSPSGATTSYEHTGKKGRYTVADMTKFALDAGFSPQQARTMGAIGMAESGGNATIDTSQTIDPGKKNEYSIGLFQVNAQAHGDKLAKLGYSEDDLRDPVKAARVAKMVYDEVGSFKPWSVYKSGKYEQYLQ